MDIEQTLLILDAASKAGDGVFIIALLVAGFDYFLVVWATIIICRYGPRVHRAMIEMEKTRNGG